jgi:hypothetical protein
MTPAMIFTLVAARAPGGTDDVVRGMLELIVLLLMIAIAALTLAVGVTMLFTDDVDERPSRGDRPLAA